MPRPPGRPRDEKVDLRARVGGQGVGAGDECGFLFVQGLGGRAVVLGGKRRGRRAERRRGRRSGRSCFFFFLFSSERAMEFRHAGRRSRSPPASSNPHTLYGSYRRRRLWLATAGVGSSPPLEGAAGPPSPFAGGVFSSPSPPPRPPRPVSPDSKEDMKDDSGRASGGAPGWWRGPRWDMAVCGAERDISKKKDASDTGERSPTCSLQFFLSLSCLNCLPRPRPSLSLSLTAACTRSPPDSPPAPPARPAPPGAGPGPDGPPAPTARAGSGTRTARSGCRGRTGAGRARPWRRRRSLQGRCRLCGRKGRRVGVGVRARALRCAPTPTQEGWGGREGGVPRKRGRVEGHDGIARPKT